ncbi:nucleotide sugar dehydrogenase, partial [Streptomyces sp. CNQ085]|nr:nucleotide sugar dehydrogenase [Streptomyces sp. CNQ085]
MPADLAVLGLGRLGLPAARAATTAGIRTIGYDPDEHAVRELGAGRPPTVPRRT